MYPRSAYPLGHSDLAQSVNNLGGLLEAQGDYDGARDYDRRALAMCQVLYSKDSYPQGHPALLASLSNLGGLLLALGDRGEALTVLRQAADMQEDQADVLLAGSSEAGAPELPGQARGRPETSSSRSRSTSPGARPRRMPGCGATRRRCSVSCGAARPRSSSGRPPTPPRAAPSGTGARPAASSPGCSWPPPTAAIIPSGSSGSGNWPPGRSGSSSSWPARSPSFPARRPSRRARIPSSCRRLPAGTVVLDLVQFTRFEQDPRIKGKKGERQTPSYIGFVLARSRPVRQVDLGPARAIDDAVLQWRRAIVAGQPSPAAGALRRLVWEPVAQHIPREAITVIVAPDGDLCAIPWAALPGDRPGTVLLERYALATVPHAPFLLDRLTAPPRSSDAAGNGVLLAVGGVAYDQAPRPIVDETTGTELRAMRRAETERGRGDGWKELPGTVQEVRTVLRLAGSRTTVRLQGDEAGTAQVLRALPRARWAHIATHGFFADPAVPSVLRPDPKLFAAAGTERVGAGRRNPLVLSGLVLAGANRSSTDVGGSARDDLGILTAEAIAGLPMAGLDLAVLSACETGLGTVAGGEGVFGLQRAFHLAGAHDVVASLWKVDDQATAAVMAIFYDRLWRQNEAPIEALRAAQLTLYHHPERIGELARMGRSPDFDKLVTQPVKPTAAGSPAGATAAPRRTAEKDWAAFVLSGWGREERRTAPVPGPRIAPSR